MKIIFEVILVIVIFLIGPGFWAIIKSPSHMKHLLFDATELKIIIDYIGSSKLIQEAASVLPVVPVSGSYLQNIEMFEKAHILSLTKTRNLLIALVIPIAIFSYFIGLYYLIGNVFLFCLPAIFPIPASAKDNNLSHLHTVILNLYKWNITDSTACFNYCNKEKPSFQILYKLVTELR